MVLITKFIKLICGIVIIFVAFSGTLENSIGIGVFGILISVWNIYEIIQEVNANADNTTVTSIEDKISSLNSKNDKEKTT